MVDVPTSEERERVLRRRGFGLEFFTLGWNVVGVVVLAVLAIASSSVALVGFCLDSLIEIGASTVVLWELSGTGEQRQRRALRLIGGAFVALALYLLVQSTVALIAGHHASSSVGGIVWTAITAVVMFSLAAGKARTGRALRNPVLITEGRVTFVDGLLAVAVLLGLGLDLALGWWWADPRVTPHPTSDGQRFFADDCWRRVRSSVSSTESLVGSVLPRIWERAACR